ncbi:hypothetical protein ABENE_14340 [Asticcacaulis benevestitus DSM 16100 = ATCC BAA-896]|uniref:DUF2975 domain-containing protein n=2 Tax=Asticcacaulis TaxID=76890 RepID=V4PPC2_9CAUL|nr:hypothetical protein ABENE_14340 [Asticcacaulis benevestitus DSM 16100 = ATCC BAA-896]
MKNLFAGFVALAYLAVSLIFRANEIMAAKPDDHFNFYDLLLPRPILLVYGLAPLLIAIAIYQLNLFTMAGRDPLTGNFTPKALQPLRLAGLFLTAGGMMYMGFETILSRLIGTEILPFNSGAGLPFMIIGFALAAISRNGNALAANAQKLRSELDDIV